MSSRKAPSLLRRADRKRFPPLLFRKLPMARSGMKKSNPRKNLHHKTVLLLISGSIAAYKIGDLITLLREQGARVPCVMTPSAKHFVTPLVLRALSGERVFDEFFTPDSPYDVLHTTLAEQADLVLAAPAS